VCTGGPLVAPRPLEPSDDTDQRIPTCSTPHQLSLSADNARKIQHMSFVVPSSFSQECCGILGCMKQQQTGQSCLRYPSCRHPPKYLYSSHFDAGNQGRDRHLVKCSSRQSCGLSRQDPARLQQACCC
jgi:hypothetical protein